MVVSFLRKETLFTFTLKEEFEVFIVIHSVVAPGIYFIQIEIGKLHWGDFYKFKGKMSSQNQEAW